MKGARLRFPQADISSIVCEGRPLRRELINELGTAQFVVNATDVIIEGFTETGKSHPACAIAKQARKRGIRSLYARMPDMLAYREEKMAAGWPEKKVPNKYAGYKALVITSALSTSPTSARCTSCSSRPNGATTALRQSTARSTPSTNGAIAWAEGHTRSQSWTASYTTPSGCRRERRTCAS